MESEANEVLGDILLVLLFVVPWIVAAWKGELLKAVWTTSESHAEWHDRVIERFREADESMQETERRIWEFHEQLSRDQQHQRDMDLADQQNMEFQREVSERAAEMTTSHHGGIGSL